MKKLFAAGAAALLVGTAYCASAAPSKGMSRRAMLSGGFVERQVEGKSIRIVNAQSKVAAAAVQGAADSIKKLLSLAVEVVPAEPGARAWPSAEHPVVIVLKDDPADHATILIAPEQAWGSVNVSALGKDTPADAVLAKRVHKEIWRVLAIALGASNSMIQPCLMAQVNSLADLDKVRGLEPSPEPFNFIMSAATKLGVGRASRCTYKRACEEGWAPAPTNDVQKAIWEKVKAEADAKPSNPIKITKEKK